MMVKSGVSTWTLLISTHRATTIKSRSGVQMRENVLELLMLTSNKERQEETEQVLLEASLIVRAQEPLQSTIQMDILLFAPTMDL